MNSEQKSIVSSFYVPVLFVLVLWWVKLIEIKFNLNLVTYGIFPRSKEGLMGIITMPFIHSDIKHLFSNTIPLIILGSALIFFYRESALKVAGLIYLLGNLWLWLGGREAWHIGASGVVYGLASFLFFSGIIRKYIRLMAISMLVVFLYGGMVWGIFPLFVGMSWEAHLFGSLAGLLCAWIYRHEGPQRPVYEWEDEEDEEDEIENESGDDLQQDAGIVVKYDFKPTENNISEKDDDKS